MKLDFPDATSTAVISGCGRYRYRLGRSWVGDGRYLLFVMLNPSTADAHADDPTIRRCIRFAMAHGFGSMEVVNLFALRATDPRELRFAVGGAVGPENDHHIAAAAAGASAVCLAYGAHELADERAQVVLPILRAAGQQLQCLHITRSGYPGHPLYLRSDLRLRSFDEVAIEAAMHGPAL